MADEVAKPPRIYRTDLLDQNASGFTEQIYLRAERCGPRAARSWRHENHGPREELVCLDYDTKAWPALLMSLAMRRSELVDVTSEHARSP